MDNLENAVDFVAAEAEKAGFDKINLNRIRLACEEIIVNIINYAYPDKTGFMDIVCKDNPARKGLRIEIEDQGIPFNPLMSAPEDTTSLPLEDRAVGGLGIHLVRKVMDELDYRRDNDRNILILVKYLN